LTSWLATEAETRGAVVLAGGCYDLTTTPPYGPWGEIVRNWPDDRGLPPVPDALRGGDAMAKLQSQAALFELAADLLATAGVVRPLVVLVEDLHWADQPSLELLRYLGRLVSGFRMMLVATYRDDEITRRHPLFQLLPVLAREPGVERVHLSRLGADAIGGLINARYAVEGSGRDRLTSYVLHVTEGNPFFASEVLRALEESHALTLEATGWRVRDLGRVGVPELLRQVIEGRLTRLGEGAHRLLQVAAIIGHEVPINVWVEVSGEDEALLSETLDRATEARIVEELPRSDGFRFTHALIRETLYEGTGLLRRRTLHRRAGEALAAASRPDPDAVAHHFTQAGDERALDWLIEAAERANDSYAWLVAVDRYERAAAIIVDDPHRRREYGWLLASAGHMVRYSNPQLAIRYMEEAATVGADVGDVWLATFPRLQAGYYRLTTGQMRAGLDQMVEVGQELEAIIRSGRVTSGTPATNLKEWRYDDLARMLNLAAAHPDQPVVLARGLEVLHLCGIGRLREARELGEQLAAVWPPEALASDYEHDTASGLGDLYLALGETYFLLGEPDRSLASSRVAVRAYGTIGHHFLITIGRDDIVRTLLAYRTEEVELRRSEAAFARDAFERARGVLPADMPPVMGGLPLVVVEGNWSTTLAALGEFASTLAQTPSISLPHQLMASYYARLAVLLGRYAEARDVVAAVMKDGNQTESGDLSFIWTAELRRAAFDLALIDEDLPAARGWLELYDRWMRWSGAILGQVEGHLGWARYHRLAGDADAAQRQAHAALAKASEPRQPLGLIASHRLLGELANQRGAYRDARDHLDQSLTLADVCAAPHERALTLVALAELDIAIGNDARPKLSEASAICQRLEARPTLERIAALVARTGGAA
jgi:tetratricopeptide (TPR) repeat protein